MADSRTYIKLHDGMPDHPKVDGLSDAGFRLLVTTWCWCSRHLTDGSVPAATWKKRGSPKARGELLAAGLATEVDGGIQMHDYLEHQRSAAEVDELRRKKQAAGSKGGKTRAERQAKAKQVLKQVPGKRQASATAGTGGRTVKGGQSSTKPSAIPIPDSSPDFARDSEGQRPPGPAGTAFQAQAPAKASAQAGAQAKSNTETEEVLRTSQTETEPVPPTAGRDAPRDTAQALIADWIDHIPKKPPGSVIGQVGKHIKAMLADGIDRTDIRRGLATWAGKGLHPSTLPSVVNEVMNARPLAAAAAVRPATTDVRVAQAQALKLLYADQPPTIRGEIAG